MFKKYNKTRLHAAEDHLLTLKVVGFREYLLGDYQLLHYERVRQCLRQQSTLELKLVEIDLVNP